jgi:hypothetical protein
MRHRQNPAWSLNGSSYPELPIQPSQWEKFLLAENMEEKDALKQNPKVLAFLIKNCRTYFVPTKVLKLYGMDWDA